MSCLLKHSKTSSSKLNLRFQRYRQFCVAENNNIQKEFHIIIGYISKSIFPTCIRLILLDRLTYIDNHIRNATVAYAIQYIHNSQVHHQIGLELLKIMFVNLFNYVYWTVSYVLWSGGISRKLNMWHISVFCLIEVLVRRGDFAENPHVNRTCGSKVIAIERCSKQ